MIRLFIIVLFLFSDKDMVNNVEVKNRGKLRYEEYNKKMKLDQSITEDVEKKILE